MPTTVYSIKEVKLLAITGAGKAGILHTLAYFDVFHYPLTKEEIIQFIDRSITETRLEILLQQLLTDKLIFLHNNFYSLQNNPLLGHRRKQGNKRAERLLPKAMGIGRFLYWFPFVRAVGISGSLSKNFADEKADIDFFIITKANRLWIARTVMHLFKKLTFLINRQHFFCMNYYIDEESLEISDRNIFTATEIKTLIQVAGDKTMQAFFEANQWADDFLPYYHSKKQSSPQRIWFKKVVEWVMDGFFVNRLDNYLMHVTTGRWKQKKQAGIKTQKGLAMELVAGKHYAYSNPGAFQEKVLMAYEQKLGELKTN